MNMVYTFGVFISAYIITHAQIQVPPEYAYPINAVDPATTPPGFQVRIVQTTTKYGTLPNTLARAEAQLGGFMMDPTTGQLLENIADLEGWGFTPEGVYLEYMPLDYSASYFPGIPGKEGHANNIALEAITYIPLVPGTYTMGVSSDDGFRVSVGDPYDIFKQIVLGEYDGGRSESLSSFSFTISTNGVYGFRLIYEQGTGSYAVRWYLFKDGQPMLLNSEIACYQRLKSGSVTTGPTIRSVYPLPGSENNPPGLVGILIEDGSVPLNVNTLRVLRNGVDITSKLQIHPKQYGKTRIIYRPDPLPDPLALEQYTISFADPTQPNGTRTVNWTFKVSSYANLMLPTPIWFEDFEGVEEGTLPAGWNSWTPMTGSGQVNLDDPHSDSYLKWTVISVDRVRAIGSAGGWDAGRRLNTPEAYINGQKINTLLSGKFVYFESDVRAGNQYAELFTPIIDLRGHSNIYLVFHSAYEQNQDNIAGIEYSVDGGQTWHPVVYMLDGPDILRDNNGEIDPISTLTNQYSDVCVYQDPQTGKTVGGYYGAFLRVPQERWTSLGPYFSARVNDDPWESKRIEKYRLPLADGQSQVKLRFFYAGTASWYWGIDNIGLYSITTIEKPTLKTVPSDATRIEGSWVSFKVEALGEALSYQWYKDGQEINGANTPIYTIESINKSDEGQYICVVSNPGGSVSTPPVRLTVIIPQINSTALLNGLYAYFPFENSFTDASGNGRNAQPIGTPGFGVGKVGQNALKVTNNRQNNSFNYVTLGSNAQITLGQSSDFTVAFWMKTERVVGDPAIIANKDWGSGNNTGWTIGTQSDGRIEWNYKRSAASRKDLDFTSWGPILNDGRWAHVVVVWHINGNAETYFNGIMVDSRSILPADGDIADPTLNLNIGQDGTGRYSDGEWDGLLDEVAFWNRALTAEEVAALFYLGAKGYQIGQTPQQIPRINWSLSGQSLILSWDAPGFVLQMNPDLTNPNQWTDVPNIVGTSVTIQIDKPTMFFRLRRQ